MRHRSERGPRVPRWLSRLVPERHREEWLGDLIEESEDPSAGGLRTTGRLYARILRSVLEARRVERRLGRADGDSRRGAAGWPRDLALALRTLRRRPVSSAAALATLALGVWAFLLGFAVADGTLFEPMGYPQEDHLVVVGGTTQSRFGISLPNHVDLVEASDLFQASGLWQGWGVLLRPEDGPWTSVAGASVSAGYLQLSGVRPVRGRLFGPEDDAPGHEPVAVVSHAAWQDLFGGAPDVVGRRVVHEGESYRIIGVTEEGFLDPLPRMLGWSQPQIWRASPPRFHVTEGQRDQVSFWSLARLRSGVGVDEAHRAVRSRAEELLGRTLEEDRMRVLSYGELLNREVRGSLLLLVIIGVGVLAVAAANLVNLLLTRAAGRAGEMAARSALGASRYALFRQLGMEAAVVGVAAALLGILSTAATLGPVVALASPLLPVGAEVTLDGSVVAAAFGLSIAFALLAALPAAVSATSEANLAELRSGRRNSSSRSRTQSALIVAQTALAVILLTSSGLLLRTLHALSQEDVGFPAESLGAVWTPLHEDLFPDRAEQSSTLDRLLGSVEALPGVTRVGAITDLPMSGRLNSTSIIRPDIPEEAPARELQTLVRAVTPGYFPTMTVPFVAGRSFEPSDGEGAVEVAVVNRTYARQHFPDRDPLGASVVVRGETREIVGIVEDVTEFSLGAPKDPVLYIPYAQTRQGWMRAGVYTVLQLNGDLPSLATLRLAAGQVDPRLSPGRPFLVSEFVRRDSAPHRFRAILASTLGALALTLASVGLAGVTAYSVRRRTREFGVRMALGASAGDVMRQVLRGCGLLTGVGLALGLLGAIPVGLVLSRFLFGVRPLDPLVILVVLVALLSATGLAAAIPTRSVLRVDATDALRVD